jgi:hypothetical protein
MTFTKIFRELNLKKALQKENWQFSEFRKQMILSETKDWVHSYRTPSQARKLPPLGV